MNKAAKANPAYLDETDYSHLPLLASASTCAAAFDVTQGTWKKWCREGRIPKPMTTGPKVCRWNLRQIMRDGLQPPNRLTAYEAAAELGLSWRKVKALVSGGELDLASQNPFRITRESVEAYKKREGAA